MSVAALGVGSALLTGCGSDSTSTSASSSAASSSSTDSYTEINGNRYQIATTLCPIITGRTLFNESLQGTDVAPTGEDTIWSSFGMPGTFPQYLDGACTIADPITVDGESMPFAECAGPMNEDTLNRPVPVGAEVTAEGPEGTFNPVGDVSPKQRKMLEG